MERDLVIALGLVGTAMLVALAALLLTTALSQRRRRAQASIFGGPTPLTVFLFDGARLLDATPAARTLLAGAGPTIDPWPALLSRLEPIFPGLGIRLEGLCREGSFVLCSREDVEPPLVLRAEHLGGLSRLTLVDGDEDQRVSRRDGPADVALREELRALREILGQLPVAVWRRNGAGEVTWANRAYLEAVAFVQEPGREIGWPLPAVFGALPGQEDLVQQASMLVDLRGSQWDAPVPTASSAQRNELRRWFEVSAIVTGDGQICHALPADRRVEAESSLRDFMQTLTKTFAQLPIGLAIFDRERALQLFNPALIDLTGLSPEFLAMRPSLAQLLDHLREHSKLPEPRDYRSWRRQMVEMELAAASGLFVDTWTLPSGQTWRVTGRPHPNGALAFLVEDISTEMTRTRRYRADLELGQAVIDAMADAVVVFAQDGAVTMSNTAARDLWGEGFQSLAPQRGEPEILADWRRRTAPTLLWNDLADYIGSFGTREPWQGELRLLDGRLLECRVSPMPHGATLVAFRLVLSHPELLPGRSERTAHLL